MRCRKKRKDISEGRYRRESREGKKGGERRDLRWMSERKRCNPSSKPTMQTVLSPLWQ